MEESKEMQGSKAQKWNKWTHIFFFADGILKTVHSSLHSTKAKDALMNVHKALQDIDKEFVLVAQAIEKGEDIPDIKLPPDNIEDWNNESVKSGIIDMLQSIVELMIMEVSKYTQNERINMLLRALKGLRTALDNFKKTE